MLKLILLLSITFSMLNSEAKEVKPLAKLTIGRVEWGEIPGMNLRHRSRIDTGAKTTSLHATNIEEVVRDGQTYVKFVTDNHEGQKKEFIRPVSSRQKVTSTSGVTSYRYVILEKIKIGTIEKEISINLHDRSKLTYRLLIGRNFLIGNFLVDVALSHTQGDDE